MNAPKRVSGFERQRTKGQNDTARTLAHSTERKQVESNPVIQEPSSRYRLFLLVVPLLLFIGVTFAPAIFSGQSFCFRDAGRFYFPLFEQIQRELNSGNLPLWDQYDNLGQPLLANPTSSVFYPLKLIFFATKLDPEYYPICFNWYILLHFPLLWLGTFRLARSFGISFYGALMSAVTCTFAVPTVFLHTNVIFLIGTAWLPWGLEQGDRLLRRSVDFRSALRPILLLAIILSLIVFGGDPQSGYLLGLLLLFLTLVYWRFGLLPEKERPILKSLFRLGLSGLLGGVLAAAAVVPALEMTRHSDRNVVTAPASIWNIPKYLSESGNQSFANPYTPPVIESKRTISDGLFCRNFSDGGMAKVRWDFSCGPWSFLELIWPSFNGTIFNGSKWTTLFPGDMFWHPSLYIGIVPLILALTVCRFRRRRECSNQLEEGSSKPIVQETGQSINSVKEAVTVWGSWTALVAAGASLGAFGIVWLCRALGALFGSGADLKIANGDPVGGIYWFLTVFLPGFASFRFPAKMFIFFVLAAALLAGVGWDRALFSRRFRRIAGAIVLLSIAVFFFLPLFGIDNIFPLDEKGLPRFGLYDLSAAVTTLLRSVAQPIILLALVAVLIFLIRRYEKGRSFITAALFLLLTIEACYVNRLYVVTRTVDLTKTETTMARVIKEKNNERNNQTSEVGKANVEKKSPVEKESNAVQKSSESGHTDRIDGSTVETKTKVEDQAITSDRSGNVTIPPRFFVFHTWIPRTVLAVPAEYRETIYAEWQQKALFPKFPYLAGIGALHSAGGTMNSLDFLMAVSNMNLIYSSAPPDIRAQLPTVWAALDVPFLVQSIQEPVVPKMTLIEGTVWDNTSEAETLKKYQELEQKDWPYETMLWQLTSSSKRLRIVRNVKKSTAVNGIDRFLADYSPAEIGRLPGEEATIVAYEANRVAFEAVLLAPGELVLADQFWPGWVAKVRPKEEPNAPSKLIPIQKELNLLRKVTLPAGKWHVEMQYRPNSVFWGMTVSLITWPIVLLALWRIGRRSGRKREL